MQRARLPYLLIPLAAFLATLPLLINGCSCGHDFDFHLLNWMEAARQFTHGNLHPHWAYTAAWNAGEPRFVFYPPISWTIGAILGLLFPWTWTPILYTWLALTAAGLAAHYLTRDFTTPTAALLAAIVYTVHPYMLFTAYHRTAYANFTHTPPQTRLRLALNTIVGTTLGLGLAAFYILPAAYERRYVQIAMAIIPNMRIQDNFLFHHTGDALHDQVLHTASLIAVVMIAATAIILLALFLSNKARVPHPLQSHRKGWDVQSSIRQSLLLPLTTLTIAI